MDEQTARRRLEEERVRLSGLVEGIMEQHGNGSEPDSIGELASYDQHQADVGTETFEREKDESIRERIEAELADIDRALAKLREGSYGTCEACGKPIEDERLDAFPAARFCVKDQAAAESGAAGPL